MTKEQEKEIEAIIAALEIDKLVKFKLLSACDGRAADYLKSNAYIQNDLLWVILGQDVEQWPEALGKAEELLVKVKSIDEHNRNHPDIYKRVQYKLKGVIDYN